MPNPLEASASSTAKAIQEQITAEQVRLLYRQLPASLGGSVLAVVVILAVLWPVTQHSLLLTWASLFAGLSLVRGASLLMFMRSESKEPNYAFWARIHLLGTFFAGLITGAVSLLPAASGHLQELSFLIVVFTGMSATALSSNGSSTRAVLAYVFPLMLPVALLLLLQNDKISLALGLLVLLFLVLIGFTAVRHGHTLQEALRLRFLNTSLYQDMAQANEKVGEIARDLQEEIKQREQAEHHLSAYAKRLQSVNSTLQQEVAERERNEQQLTRQALEILESEVRMRAIFQNAFDAIVTFNAEGLIDSANPAACNLFGYGESELVGSDIRELMAADEDVFATRRLVENEGRRANGSLFPLAFGVERMHIGQDVQYVCILRDQTSAAEAKEALIGAKEAAEAANKAKSEFLSSMSHELRTPLNAIIGFAQLLQNDATEPLSEGQAESVEQIGSAGWHLLRLINDVLDLAKIEAGRMDVTAEDVPVRDLLQECLGLVQSNAEEKDILLLDETGEADVILSADYVRVKQVLLNLLSNAIKYNRPGGRVSLVAPETRDGQFRLAVEDTGDGLTPEQIDTIFTPFVRVADNKAEIEGTGIGLTITQRLLEMMGGRIGVESRPGEGSLFWFELPLAGGTGQGLAQVAVTDPKSPGRRIPDGHFRVLYVEDNPANLKLVQSVIRRQRPNIELISAPDGEAGLELALTEHLDLILLDISLPGMNGFEILQALRMSEDTRSIPTLALSANAMAEDVEQGRKAGFKDYLTKPIDVQKLLAALDTHLGARAA